MRRIGDVLKEISIPIGNRPTNGSGHVPRPKVTCELCQDAGYVRLNVPIDHPKFGSIVPCRCRVKETEERAREDLRRLSNLDTFDGEDFEDFDPSIPGTEEAFDIAYAYAQNPEGWLFLHGRCGVGKTHLAVAIARHAVEHHGVSVLFQVVPDLLDRLRATFDPGSGVAYDERFEQIREAGLLVLDDLGTENTTPWAREKLYQIFNHRYNERSPTVVTSNQELKNIDERIASRLLDTRLTKTIELDAEDYRRRGRPDYVRSKRR
jgi:DNA replication protein DnaC